jgi:hypothetical protein
VFLVIIHPVSLGLLLEEPVSPKEARRFRKMVIRFFLAGVLAISGGLCLIPISGNYGYRNQLIGAIGGTVITLLAWLLIRLSIGASRWFYCPPALSPAQQETSLALSYYLTAPLSLASLAWLTLLIPLGGQTNFPVTQWCLLTLGMVALSLYLVSAGIGLRVVARRRGWNLFLSVIGLDLIWITIWGGLISLPVTVAMWLGLFLT